MKKTSWIIMGLLSTLVGLYPLIYFFVDRKFGLLSSKSDQLLSDIIWNVAFYGHIILGGLALLIGWIQFSNKMRVKRAELHRTVGKIYIISVLISGVSGLYIALFATGGVSSMLGFIFLGIIWLLSTVLGFRAIKNGDLKSHESFMIISYAACFAAVTLRVWLPLLTAAAGDFIIAYRIVAWLCWIPNIVVALLIIKYRNTKGSIVKN